MYRIGCEVIHGKVGRGNIKNPECKTTKNGKLDTPQIFKQEK